LTTIQPISGLIIEPKADQVVHIRPHDFEIIKVVNDSADNALTATLKDWQHLGALIRIKLAKNGVNGTPETIYAEMPNEQFKRLQLVKGDKVGLRIRHAHWFRNDQLTEVQT